MKHWSFYIWLMISLGAYSQEKFMQIDSIPKEGILLNKGWKFHAGDNPEWPKSDFDDSKWKNIDPTADIVSLGIFKENRFGWFRLTIKLDTLLSNKTYALSIKQTGSSQIFVNGKLIHQVGKFSTNTSTSESFDPSEEAIPLLFSEKTIQTLAIRFEKPEVFLIKHILYNNVCLKLKMLPVEFVVKNFNKNDTINLFEHYLDIFKSGVFFVLCCFHFWLYNYDKSKKGNLFIFLWTLSTSFIFIIATYSFYPIKIYYRNLISIGVLTMMSVQLFFHYWAIILVFNVKKSLKFWIIIGLLILSIPLIFLNYEWGWAIGAFLMMIVVSLEIANITWKAYKEGDKAARIITISQILFFTFTISSLLVVNNTIKINIPSLLIDLIVNIGVIAPPFAYIYYFASNYELNRKSLQFKLVEIQQLSEEKQNTLLQKNAELQAAILQGQTTERRRVAIDLHDNLGSTLSSIGWSMDAIDKSKMTKSEQKIYQNLKEMILTAYNEVRLLSHNLLPEELEKQGLVVALQTFVRKLNKNTQTHFELQIPQNFNRLDKRTEFELYTITLELVNNILKHSHATHASIVFELENQNVKLSISDNGRGLFENNSDGKGLKNVQARVESLRGKWEIKSKENEGTNSIIIVPI